MIWVYLILGLAYWFSAQERLDSNIPRAHEEVGLPKNFFEPMFLKALVFFPFVLGWPVLAIARLIHWLKGEK